MFFDQLLAFATPQSCLLCGQTPSEAPLCSGCCRDLPSVDCACNRCGAPGNAGGICFQCQQNPPVYDRVTSAYRYEYPVSTLIKNIKYKKRPELLRALSNGLVERIIKSADMPDCIVPVPLHYFRLVERGFNQSLELSRLLGRQLQLPVDHGLLKRNRATVPQSSLAPEKRAMNVRRAFSLSGQPRYRCVALVDDIITSGATANEIARLLKNSGIKQVFVWSLAHAASG